MWWNKKQEGLVDRLAKSDEFPFPSSQQAMVNTTYLRTVLTSVSGVIKTHAAQGLTSCEIRVNDSNTEDIRDFLKLKGYVVAYNRNFNIINISWEQ